MKTILKLITILLFVTTYFSPIAKANCHKAYEDASFKRSMGQLVVIAGVSVASLVGSTVLPALSVVAIGGIYFIQDSLSGASEVLPNKIKKVKEALNVLSPTDGHNQYHQDIDGLDRIIKEAIKKANLEYSPELKAHVMELMLEGYENETFCPVVKITKKGVVKRSVFTKKALVTYIASELLI